MRASLATERICDTSSVEPGRSTKRGAPLVQPAQLMQERLLAFAVGDGVRRPDDVDWTRKRRFAQPRGCARCLSHCPSFAGHARALLS